MKAYTDPTPSHAQPSFAELFTPKLVTVLREGYGANQFRADLTAGLTVAIIALPLSMAIAIASGVSPDRGLYTAIVGGFLISALAAAVSRSEAPLAPSSCLSPRQSSGMATTACCWPP